MNYDDVGLTHHTEEISVPQLVTSATVKLYNLTINASQTDGPGTLGLVLTITDGENIARLGDYSNYQDFDSKVYANCIAPLKKFIGDITWIYFRNVPFNDVYEACTLVINKLKRDLSYMDSREYSEYKDSYSNFKKEHGWYMDEKYVEEED